MAPRQRSTKHSASTTRARAGTARTKVVRAKRVLAKNASALGDLSVGTARTDSISVGSCSAFLARKIARHLIPGVIASAIAFVGVAAIGNRYSVLIENPTVVPNQVEAGANATLHFTARGFDLACRGVVDRSIINSKGIITKLKETATSNIKPIEHGGFDFSRTFPVPLGAAPGPATYKAVVTRWCNPIQKFFWPIVEETDVKFSVAPPAVTLAPDNKS